MRGIGLKSATLGALGALGGSLLLLAAAAPPRLQTPEAGVSEIVLKVNPAQSLVHWSVDSTLHMVHGTFAVKNGTLRFDPETGHAGGEIIVDATSGESGNNSRDARLHKEILETRKYPDVIFRPTQLEGKVAVSGPSDGQLHGVFSVRGADHDLIAAVHAELSGDHWNGTAKFEVPYVQWGIKDPSNFFLKVKPIVNVKLELSGEVKAPK